VDAKVYPLGPDGALGWDIQYAGNILAKYRFSRRFLPWLRKHAAEYDAVIVNGLWQYHSFATWRALHGSGTPYFVFPHGELAPWFKHAYPLKHVKKWLYWPWAEYRVLRDARAVVFTCDEERRQSRQSFWLYKCREAVVNLGTSGPEDMSQQQLNLFAERFPEVRGKRVLLFLSRIHPKKGCDLLLEAFARIAARDQTLHLVMAGPDQTDWQAALSAQATALGISSRITWSGMLTGSLKWGAYLAAEVFILPSHAENFGLVVAEALACGLPVLLSDKVNIWREIIADGAGLAANDDVAGTTSLLERWLALPAREKETMRSKAKQCFVNRYEIGNVAESMIEMLRVYGVSDNVAVAVAAAD
jgi:glycosyltransferase involved in cell wall biosynthesis